MGIEIDDTDRLPFYSQGLMVCFNSRYPDDAEMETYPHIVITSNNLWDPHRLIMPGGLDESGLLVDDRMIQQVQSDQDRGINQHHHMYETDCVFMSVDGNTEQLLMECMINSVHVSSVRHMEKLQSKTRHSQYSLEHIAAIFNVGIGTAKDILTIMNRQVFDMPLHPSLGSTVSTTYTSTIII